VCYWGEEMLLQRDCSLRTLTEGDLTKILNWRNKFEIRQCMFNDSIISIDEHLDWFNKLKNDPHRMTMIYEYKEKPAGVINITQIDKKNSKCYWGFYLGEGALPRYSGLAMGYLGLNFIFEKLGINKLCSEVFIFNKSSLKYHQKLGFVEEGYFKKHVFKYGDYHDIICWAIFNDNWLGKKLDVAKQCFGGEEK